ncbi:MAG: gamma-glutamyltransferase family protein, partial [Actinomycetota bacterium]|nr:gamma-glutamyltransferase family protein [Actinomycetota bacterium]
GGGFLLAAPADGEAVVFDFFVDTPGRGRSPERAGPSMTPVPVRFAGADQVFHVGWGSVAVPGCLDGYLHVHRRRGRLPLADVVAPARELADRGTVLDSTQASLLTLLEDIVTLSPDGRAVFTRRGRLLGVGDRMRNELLAGFLDEVGAGRVTGFAAPPVAGPLEGAMSDGGGQVTAEDLRAYAVIEREPLQQAYRGARLLTNPPPSFGGSLVLDGLTRLEEDPPLDGSPGGYVRLAEVLVEMSERHITRPMATRGTTHVSVVDGEGNVAAMTTSNGSCSGRFAPGTGIQLNNVLGEADLHPRGFAVTPPGVRVGSMMAPSVVTTAAGTTIGVGSAGSERIRSALTAVLSALLDQQLPLAAAVRAPRLHWDRSALQAEPGVPAETVAALRRHWPVNVWQRPDLYFGGAHGVARRRDGSVRAAGDDRRGGVGVVIDLP